MLKNFSSVGFAFLYTNIVGYVFHFFVSRKLGPQSYGEFMVLYSLMLSVSNVANLFGVSAVKHLVESKRSFEVLRYMRALSLFIGSSLMLTGVFLSPLIVSFLKVSHVGYLWVVASVWLFQSLLVIERSYLQSLERFPLFSVSLILEQTVRLFAVFLLLQLGLNVVGAIFSSLIGIMTSLFLLIRINGNLIGGLKRVSTKEIIKTSLYASPSGLFIYADDIFIRRVFDPHTAGLYASVSLVGKAFLWLVLTLTGTLFPRMVEFKEESGELKNLITRVVLVVLSLSVLTQVGLFLVGKPLFILLFSNKFLPAYPFLSFYLVSILPLSFVMVALSLFTALTKMLWLLYTHLILYYLGFLIVPLESVYSYMAYMFSINLIFVILYLLIFQSQFRKPLSKCQT